MTILLALLCGALHGANPDPTDVMVYFLLFNTIFAALAASSAISSLGSPVTDSNRQ